MVSRAVTLPPLILDSVHLANGRGAGCVPVEQNNAFVLFRFPLSACGTTFQVRVELGEARMGSLSCNRRGFRSEQGALASPFLRLMQQQTLAPLGQISGFPSSEAWSCKSQSWGSVTDLSLQMAGDQGVYENELVAFRDVRTWSLGSITRDSTFR